MNNGWSCYEDNSDPEILDPETKEKIVQLKTGQNVLVFTLFGYVNLTVREINGNKASADDTFTINGLNFNVDKNYWTSERFALNMRSIKKLMNSDISNDAKLD